MISVGEKMDKKALFDSFNRLENDAGETLNRISELKDEVEALVEENASLRIENQHLRDRLTDLEKQQEDANKEASGTEMSKSRLNLEKFMKMDSMSVMCSTAQEESTMNRARFV